MNLSINFRLIIIFFVLITHSVYSQDIIPKKKKILILHSVEELRPWNKLYNESFLAEIKKNTNIKADISIEYLDLIRYNTNEYKDILEKLILSKYQNTPPDIIVLTQIAAVNFIFDRKLFPTIPKILVEIETSPSQSYLNSATIINEFNFNIKLKHALEIFPNTKEVYVVAGSNKVDAHTLDIFNTETHLLNKTVSFKYITNINRNAILDSIKHLPANSFVYYLPFTQDLNGEPVMARDFSFDLAKYSNRPVFSFIDLLTEETGIFGGMVNSLHSIAEKTAETIEQVFNGENIENIPSLEANNSYIYDWNELQKWNIDINKLPKESIFYNRKYSFFELYKYQVIIGFILILLYTFLLILLLVSNLKRKKSANDLFLKNKEYEAINEVLKKTNTKLQQAKNKAEESDRLKSAFLANMSHEIRTPMNGILGFSALLKSSNISSEKQQEFIEIVEKSGKRMLNIINDIIDISKIEAGLINVEIKESNINQQIEYIYTFFKPEVEAKGIQFSYKNTLPIQEAIINTDREKLFAIFTNLVKNAIKYTNNGFIEFGYILKSSNEFSTNGQNNELEFFVKDTGIGIPKDRQEAVFERFIQADISDKMARQGAGLGLSITKAYIEMLGGKIWLESQEGIGSTFYFTLPYNVKSNKKNKAKPIEVIDNKKNKIKNLKILIAEDDETSNMLLSINVKEFSNKIIKASTGTEAVEICSNNPDLNLILMDIQMPGLNGYEATRQIRKFNKDVIIIAQTAYGLSGDREKSLKAGCNDYITKPINKIELVSLIHKYFNK